jgi:hypothetical protein
MKINNKIKYIGEGEEPGTYCFEISIKDLLDTDSRKIGGVLLSGLLHFYNKWIEYDSCI